MQSTFTFKQLIITGFRQVRFWHGWCQNPTNYAEIWLRPATVAGFLPYLARFLPYLARFRPDWLESCRRGRISGYTAGILTVSRPSGRDIGKIPSHLVEILARSPAVWPDPAWIWPERLDPRPSGWDPGRIRPVRSGSSQNSRIPANWRKSGQDGRLPIN